MERTLADGRRVLQLRASQKFATYQEASAFLKEHEGDGYVWRLAGSDPLRSCVPLEALANLKEVFRSSAPDREDAVAISMGPTAPVRIFEYVGAAGAPALAGN